MTPANHRDRRLGRPEQAQLVVFRQCAGRGQHPTVRRRQRVGGPGERPRENLGGRAVLARHDQRGEAPEGRQPGPAAPISFLVVKALAIAGQHRAHDRVLGLPGLDIRVARGLEPSRAPGHLLQQLKGSLGRARIARRQANIRVDHADQRKTREIMPLRHKLGADDDIAFAARDRLDFRAQTLRAACNIRGEGEDPARGKSVAASSANLSMPGPQAASKSTASQAGQTVGLRSIWPQ